MTKISDLNTSQSYIARIEGGTVRPSTAALEPFAEATRTCGRPGNRWQVVDGAGL